MKPTVGWRRKEGSPNIQDLQRRTEKARRSTFPKIIHAYERILKSAVKYGCVIDMAALKA